VNPLILVVDDEPDVAMLFRQDFRRDLREGRFVMEFSQSGEMALRRIVDVKDVSLILILSDINMPGMNGLELLPKAKAARARRSGHHDHGLWRCRDKTKRAGKWCRRASYQTH
jgi:CheY-like chemotaxis protein